METNCGNRIFIFKIAFLIFAMALADEKVDQDSSLAKNQEWNDIDRAPESGAWVPADGGNTPQGPIGGWDDDIDRGFLPGGNLHPDDDPKQWKIEDSIPGIPGQSYPNYVEVPDTTFDCRSQKDPGYYGDVEARCQVFHICQLDGRHNSFLCPLGTIFDQKTLVCDWWFNVNCADTPNYYIVNSNLYKDGGSVDSEWSARKGETSGSWGNVAQPIPDGAVSWTMRNNNLESNSKGPNIPIQGSWRGRGTTNHNKGSGGFTTLNRQGGLDGNTLSSGGSRNLFDGFRTSGHVKGTSMRRSRRFHAGNRRMRIMQNQKGGSQRWSESIWPASNEKGHENFGEHRNMKGGFSMMNGRNEFPFWDSSRYPNSLKGQNDIGGSWTEGKGSARQGRRDIKGQVEGRRQVSWTNTVNHNVQNWNKGSNEINLWSQTDGRDMKRKFPARREFKIQERVSGVSPKGQDGRWNGASRSASDHLQWDDDYDSQRQHDYDY